MEQLQLQGHGHALGLERVEPAPLHGHVPVRNYNYDTTLQWLPPPWFPVLDEAYTVSLFREVNP